MYFVKCICQQAGNYLFICHVRNKSKPTVDSLYRHFDLINFVFLFWNSKEKLLNCGVQHFDQGGQPCWPVCPVDEEKVNWNPTEYQTEPDTNHLRLFEDRHEDQEAADDEEDDGKNDVHFDRPLEIWLFPSEIEKSAD